ncbi:MAG: GlsB/YeaQ/YmgE family stress response membrane protein [Nocardioidaceae bacterium]
MIGFLISLVIVGLIAGALARLAIPGKQDIGIPATILIGIIGSFVGGFLGFLIFDHNANAGFLQTSGLIGSVIGAIIVLYVYTRFINKTITSGR